MDWVMQCAMFWPLACYLMVLGLFNSARRPVLVPGSADTALLCCGMSGLMIVGPLALILRPLVHQGETYPLVVAAAVFFTLSLLVIALQRRRLVLYNCTAEQFQRFWPQVLTKADPRARSLGSLYVLPTCGVSVRVDPFAPLRNVSLVADSNAQNPEGWRTLEQSLASGLAAWEGGSRALKAPLVMWTVCLILLLAPIGWLLSHQDAAGDVVEFLRRLGYPIH
jgi:hypothetical protein